MAMRKNLLIIALFIVLIFSITGCAPDEELILDDKAALISEVNEALENGDEELDFYVRGMTEDDIYELNLYMDGFWGDCDEYVVDYDDSEGVIGGTLYLKQSDNYYAYNNYISGTEIPKNRKDAQAVADKLPEIIESVSKDSEYETELATHDYIIAAADYDETIDENSNLNTAYGALIEGTTMCNGYADAMTLILECMEIDARVIVGESEGEAHAWNLVELDDVWYHVDATWDDSEEDDAIFHIYFNVNDEDMASTHEWEKELFPACTGESYKYFKEGGIYFENYDAFKQGLPPLLTEAADYLEVMVANHSEEQFDYDFVFDTISGDEFYYYEEEAGTNMVIMFDLR